MKKIYNTSHLHPPQQHTHHHHLQQQVMGKKVWDSSYTSGREINSIHPHHHQYNHYHHQFSHHPHAYYSNGGPNPSSSWFYSSCTPSPASPSLSNSTLSSPSNNSNLSISPSNSSAILLISTNNKRPSGKLCWFFLHIFISFVFYFYTENVGYFTCYYVGFISSLVGSAVFASLVSLCLTKVWNIFGDNTCLLSGFLWRKPNMNEFSGSFEYLFIPLPWISTWHDIEVKWFSISIIFLWIDTCMYPCIITHPHGIHFIQRRCNLFNDYPFIFQGHVLMGLMPSFESHLIWSRDKLRANKTWLMNQKVLWDTNESFLWFAWTLNWLIYRFWF